jgi:hypothetical protein
MLAILNQERLASQSAKQYGKQKVEKEKIIENMNSEMCMKWTEGKIVTIV